MKPMPTPGAPQRVHIERLDLDMRGLPHALAESTAGSLDAALARALAAHPGPVAGTIASPFAGGARIDAGHVAAGAAPAAGTLAQRIAERIVRSVRGD